MRFRLAALALLLVSLPVQAQDDAYMEDDEGDVTAMVAGNPASPPTGGESADLTAVYFQEVPEGFRTTFEVASLADDGTLLDHVEYSLYLEYGGIQYAITITRDFGLAGEGPFYNGRVGEVVEENGYTYQSYRGGMDVTVEDNRLTGIAPRDAFTDSLGAPPGVGSMFTDIWAQADGVDVRIFSGTLMQESTYKVTDRMPDDGFGPDFEVQFGVVQEGDAALASEAPYRLSNGGATSMVYDVTAHNAGERQAFRLAVDGVPADWSVQLPFDRLVLEEYEEITFPILVTTPSGHVHGGSESFLLTMTGQQDAGDVGRIEMGVKFADVPQPAGHHPKLWIHSYQPYGQFLGDVLPGLGSGTQGYMNALEEDPSDLGVPIPAWGNAVPGLESRFDWWIPLVPDLGMGLDFDTTQQATLNIPVSYDYLAQDVSLSGELRLWTKDFEEGLTVGTLQPTTPASWGPGTHTFEAVMDISPDADFIPYSPEAYLYLELTIEGTFVGVAPFGPGSQASIQPGATIVLPLNEYRDEVQSFYKAVEALRFDADFLERSVNPGKTVVFETHLRNVGDTAETIDLNLSGADLQWGRILGDKEFTLKPGDERTVAVAVAIPGEAADGAADLLLQATSQEDPFKQAIISFVALIDTETDYKDESDRVDELESNLSHEKKSPGFEIVALGMAVLALALLRRR